MGFSGHYHIGPVFFLRHSQHRDGDVVGALTHVEPSLLQPLLRLPNQPVALFSGRLRTDQSGPIRCLVRCGQIAEELGRALVDQIRFLGFIEYGLLEPLNTEAECSREVTNVYCDCWGDLGYVYSCL
jgi:hypothetical protein